MATKQCSDEERAIIAEGAVMFGSWAEGKPFEIVLACAVSLATRIAARLSMDETDFIDFVRANLRDARKTRELQRGLGGDARTLIDGERRVLLPRELGGDAL